MDDLHRPPAGMIRGMRPDPEIMIRIRTSAHTRRRTTVRDRGTRSHHETVAGPPLVTRKAALSDWYPVRPGATAGPSQPSHALYFAGENLYLRLTATWAAGKSSPKRSEIENDTLWLIGVWK